MNYSDIKRHLVPYRIFQKRKTTINHAFAAAIAPSDIYDPETVRSAIKLLGQDPNLHLFCVYCDEPAETWDHVFATVMNSEFSGAGHRIGNLLPCCKPCNSRKGNKNWEAYIIGREESGSSREHRIAIIRNYLEAMFSMDTLPTDQPQYRELSKVKEQIFELMKRADFLSDQIRQSALPCTGQSALPTDQ